MDLILEMDMINRSYLIVRSFKTAEKALGKSYIPIHFLKKYSPRKFDYRGLCVPS